MGIIIALIVGGVAGWIASMIAGRDSSLGVVGNIVVGFLGAVLANLFGGGVQLSNPTWGGFLLAILGATVLLAIVNLVTRKSIR
jgi:uncharacterized membrane protein YeaQ/YmgE (transglycosylase-associated protein family)